MLAGSVTLEAAGKTAELGAAGADHGLEHQAKKPRLGHSLHQVSPAIPVNSGELLFSRGPQIS